MKRAAFVIVGLLIAVGVAFAALMMNQGNSSNPLVQSTQPGGQTKPVQQVPIAPPVAPNQGSQEESAIGGLKLR